MIRIDEVILGISLFGMTWNNLQLLVNGMLYCNMFTTLYCIIFGIITPGRMKVLSNNAISYFQPAEHEIASRNLELRVFHPIWNAYPHWVETAKHTLTPEHIEGCSNHHRCRRLACSRERHFDHGTFPSTIGGLKEKRSNAKLETSCIIHTICPGESFAGESSYKIPVWAKTKHLKVGPPSDFQGM